MQVARAAVDDEQWRAFRQLALDRGLSVSAYLGRLVEAELKRRKALAAGGVEPKASDVDHAIAALMDVRASIDDLEAIAARLVPSAVARGASWGDVAGALGIDEERARVAYDQ